MTIRWDDPLEAHNRDTGETHALDPLRPNSNQFWPFVAYCPGKNKDFFLNKSGLLNGHINSGNSTGDWVVRNRQPAQTATDRLERLEAFVARIATGLVGTQVVVDNAKALAVEIAPPVDRDVLVARELASAAVFYGQCQSNNG